MALYSWLVFLSIAQSKLNALQNNLVEKEIKKYMQLPEGIRNRCCEHTLHPAPGPSLDDHGQPKVK